MSIGVLSYLRKFTVYTVIIIDKMYVIYQWQNGVNIIMQWLENIFCQTVISSSALEFVQRYTVIRILANRTMLELKLNPY